MKLRMLQEAQTETEQAAQWYEDKRPGLGEDFLNELDSIYAKLEDHPHRPLRLNIPGLEEREIRQRMLHRFPYKVVSEVGNDELIVLAVAHRRRKPGYWASRAL